MDNVLEYPDPVRIELGYSLVYGLVAWWGFRHDGTQYGAAVQLGDNDDNFRRVLDDVKSTYKYAKEKSDG